MKLSGGVVARGAGGGRSSLGNVGLPPIKISKGVWRTYKSELNEVPTAVGKGQKKEGKKRKRNAKKAIIVWMELNWCIRQKTLMVCK